MTTLLPEYKEKWIKSGAYKYAIDSTAQPAKRIFCATIKEVHKELNKQSKYSTCKVFRMVRGNNPKSIKDNVLCLLDDLSHKVGPIIGHRDYFIQYPKSLIDRPNSFLYQEIKIKK